MYLKPVVPYPTLLVQSQELPSAGNDFLRVWKIG